MRKKTTKKTTTKAIAVKEETVTTGAKDTTKEVSPVKETVKKATDH